MTVKDLKRLLQEAPDDMIVMVMVEDHLHPGMFAFAEACECDTGCSTLGPGPDGGGEEVFLVMPHGSGVPDDDIESGEYVDPIQN